MPSVAIGHQIAVTPLRLAAAHASLVNGGRLVEPHVLPGDGAPPKPVWPAAVAAAVRSAMVDMVELESRTWLHGVPFRYGGKSGTVQDERDPTHYTSLFVGFAPAEAPRFLALVVADRPRGSTYYGSKVCGPAVRNLLHFALAAAGEVPPPPPLDPPSFAAIVPAGER
ncbi:MAG: hypothetical protein D6702_01390 [Planctomycetota bacterium]|nr:MAG: hypothetical protein D6702_01390 [Planctomycetota bacterium]